ncbi:hypothetical protein CGCSCA4_v002307 [Colletotrichum siamense]|uniref:Uncharacterized protein n=1 Tax=Colletotrichum siamense TaxID=690259 RepID=A0A9P5F2G5_COLSI|nr:hypothetical protein CGCSCA4_v002307 [Colletotrichum siamense]KAF4864200.1 hypothetical protein CGCSCA2_v002442 [Colletotrichum siamense]
MEPRDEEITVPEERDQSDATINYIAATSSIPYETAAKVSMTMMLDHTLGEYRPQGKVPCTLCQDDDTVDAERKEKLMTVGHLNEHLASDFHTGYKKWQRQAMIAREGNFFRCPYCTEVHPQHDSYSFKSLKDLLRHVRRSNSNKIANGSGWDTPALAAKHDKLKADAGWYDDDWTTNTSTEVKR